jgi:cell pole-organizing protein PopZ
MSNDGENNEPSIDDIVASIRRIISDEETRTRKPPVGATPAPKNEDILELTNMLNEDGSVTPLPSVGSATASPPVVPLTDSDDDAPIYAEKPQAETSGMINRPPPRPASDDKTRIVAPASPAPPAARAADPGSAPQPSAPPPPPPSNPVRASSNMTATNMSSGSGVTLTPVNSAPATGSGNLVSPQAAGAATAAFDRLTQAALQQNAPAAAATKPTTPAIGTGRSVEDLVREMLRPMLQQWMDANLPGMVERLVQQEIQRLTKR